MLSDRCLSVLSFLSVCDVGVLWPNGWMDEDETWHAGRPRPWPHCVRWVPSSPPQKGVGAPNFRPMCVVAKWLHGLRCPIKLGMEVGLSPSDFVLDGNTAPFSQTEGGAPQFSAYVCCGQTAG